MPYVLKEYAGTPSRPFKMFRKPIDERRIPWEWKTENVVPVLKKEDRRTSLEDRPVVCVPIEMIMIKHVHDCLGSKNFMNMRQHGIRVKRSYILSIYWTCKTE